MTWAPWRHERDPAVPVEIEAERVRAEARRAVEKADRLADRLLASLQPPEGNGKHRHA